MRTSKTLFVVVVLAALRLAAQQPPTITLNQVVDKMLSQERAEMETLQQYSPLVEGYITGSYASQPHIFIGGKR